jgi:hypothetical protein
MVDFLLKQRVRSRAAVATEVSGTSRVPDVGVAGLARLVETESQ